MSVSFNTIPSGIRVPLFYAEMDNSSAATPTDESKSLLIGQMLDGTAEVGVPVTVSTAAMAKKLFGRGSMLARMVEAYRTVDSFGQLVCIPVKDGQSAGAATGNAEVKGEALEAGTLSFYVGGERIQVAVKVGDSGETVATALSDAISLKKDLPVTAGAVDGVVTFTAKTKGTVGNGIQLNVNLRGLINGEAMPSGISVKITAMNGGTVDPEVADAIKAMGDEAYDFIGCPYADTAVLDAFQTEMNDTSGRWSPYRMLFGHVYTAKRGDINDLKSFGTARNDQHATIVGVEPAMPTAVEEVLAAYLARTAVFISADPARPTQTGVLTGVMASPEGSRFAQTDRQTLLENGIATLYTISGSVMIERAITTYQKNSFGDADASYLDSETLHTSAYVLRQMKSIITSKYARHKLASDGTRFGAGQAIVTPSVIRGELIALYRRLELEGIVENADLFKKYLIVERNVNNPNRLDVLFPPDYVNQLRIFAVLNQFRLQHQE
jgi:phage tail sheath gpL-like